MTAVSRSLSSDSPSGSPWRLGRWLGERIRWRPSRVRLNLALQGGGAHGAFTWGVLDRLLDEPWIDFEGLSGASAGAMNAAVLASGYLGGGRLGAQSALHDFWRSVSQAAHLGPLQPTVLEQWLSGWNRDRSPSYLLLRTLAKLASPYQRNPAGYNPLLPLLERHVDFEALRRSRRVKLFIAVTSVRTGMLRLVRNHELSPVALAASACLPLLFQAVELDDGYYWDGGYSANPALAPLLLECGADDVLMIRLSPVSHPELPKRIDDIVDRAREIGFNAGFLRELQLLAQLAQRGGRVSSLGRAMGRLRLHQIHTGDSLDGLGKASRINAEWPFLRHLRDLGREHAEAWLHGHGKSLGRRSSLPLSVFSEGT